jgi:hypothetical protein
MSAATTGRDTRIDFIRGLFILMVCVDHFGFLVALIGSHARAKLYTYQSIGWSSGAEFFVFFSGYVIASVYSRTMAGTGFWKTQLRAGHRAWELYVRNALIWVLALAMMHGFFNGDTALLAATQISRASSYPDAGILAFMTLRYAPTYFEVLPLYMALMLLAPGFLWLHARSRFAAIGLSALVWLAVQLHPQLNFYSDQGAWNFNPFAWQFVFFLGMWFAKECPLTGFNRDRRPRKAALVVAVLAMCAVLKLLDKADVVLPLIGAIDIPGHAKPNLEPLRLAHFLLVIYLVGLAMPSNDWVRRRWVTRGVALVGTHSLDCFCFSILLCYASAGLFSTTPRGTFEYFVLVALNVSGLVLAALWFTWLKTPPWRPPSGGAPKELAPQVAPGATAWLPRSLRSPA